MAEQTLRDRTLAIIQRDNLSEFLKKSVEVNSGCAYYGIIGVYNYLYPSRPLPRDIKEKFRIGTHGKRYNVNINSVIKTIDEMEPLLGLRVTSVDNYSASAPSEIQKIMHIPENIPITNIPIPKLGISSQIASIKENESGLLLTVSSVKPEYHLVHMRESSHFMNENLWVRGGIESLKFIKQHSHQPLVIYHIEKSGRF